MKNSCVFVVSDIDDTLMHERKVSEATRKLLSSKPGEIVLCYSSGSSLDSIRRKLDSSGMPYPDIIASENGSRLYNIIDGRLAEDISWSSTVFGRDNINLKLLEDWVSNLPYRELVTWKN
ncbi:hypothetical protein HYU11_03390 [Candidatus Woesearchaeota archaeon]|nr:hypothetical protein [Candidatus Woesearchaeota archaeon]